VRAAHGTGDARGARTTRLALFLVTVLSLAACQGPAGISLGGAKPPATLSLISGVSFSGSVYVASGGRIWKLKGATARALTPTSANYAYPAVTTDGQVSAATLVGKGHSEIALGGPDFGALTPLTRAPANPHDASLDLKPAFSPDGGRLAFMSDRSKSCSEELVYEGPYRPYRPRPVTTCPDIGGSYDSPAYLADGSALLMVSWGAQRAQLEEAAVPLGRLKLVSLFDDQDLLDPAPGVTAPTSSSPRRRAATARSSSPASATCARQPGRPTAAACSSSRPTAAPSTSGWWRRRGRRRPNS
jgi:hypothetical protein